MALNKQALKQGIIDLHQDMLTKTNDSIEEYAERLASLIDAFVRSGEVTVAAGISVSTVGTATAQTGATNSTGTGTIS
ncbi:hypothetical protein [Capnocytophaga sputigena]|jgi:hypothetical protein|uniref:Uncharacterized protein n=1 Tax=Capnocytophaga sputigena TaxID=1019 RepID=A0AAX2I8W9_CAPSP|nr:hypothetical protein [Capnocytophaga sputigena]ATA83548.1 hypothetical protein CGC55_03035 [Capnocytophaga sputigena]ATA85508.1 hypothetical protein CGC55_13815 [Capnocytophaga sputigena]EEB64747.1 hypothetical protein CAPSP0001_2407 [Capnocytophaga sputigena ATCC 33612]SQA74517.1 Uncharacterised protein [Capnocytophaga sputigena]